MIYYNSRREAEIINCVVAKARKGIFLGRRVKNRLGMCACVWVCVGNLFPSCLVVKSAYEVLSLLTVETYHPFCGVDFHFFLKQQFIFFFREK